MGGGPGGAGPGGYGQMAQQFEQMELGRGVEEQPDQMYKGSMVSNGSGQEPMNRMSGGPAAARKPELGGAKPAGPLNVDDMVIPAITGGAGNQMTEYPEEDPRNHELAAEELSGDNRKAAQPLIDMFGEQVVRKLFSRTWQLKEEALGEVEDEVLNNQRKYNREEAFVNAVGAVRFAITDKMAQVIQRAC